MMKRFEELDSLRGLAATTVVLSHIALIVPGLYLFSLFEHTPLHLFWGGHEAVILFFLLSGFVLALPFIAGKEVSYLSFLIKRVCRIYPPYLVAVFFSIAVIAGFQGREIKALGSWFNGLGSSSLSNGLVAGHLTLVGSFNNSSYNPVIWSLVHEMRISLLFPFIILFVLRFGWKANVALGLLFSLMYMGSLVLGHTLFGYRDLYNSSPFLTLHYISMFIMGALAAKNRYWLHNIWKKMSPTSKWGLLGLGILAYTYPRWFLPRISLLHFPIVNDWATGAGALIFIWIGLHSVFASSFLRLKPIHFIGKISYSLYLIHTAVLYGVIRTLHEAAPLWLVLLAAVVLCYLTAAFFYYLFELPSVRLGKRLTSGRAGANKAVVTVKA